MVCVEMYVTGRTWRVSKMSIKVDIEILFHFVDSAPINIHAHVFFFLYHVCAAILFKFYFD